MNDQNINDLKNIVYIQSQITCAQIELAAMQAENKNREMLGHCIAYSEKDFNDLILKYGIYHNAVIEATISR